MISTQRGQPELLDVLASGSPPAFAVDSRGRIVFWNSGAERLLGHRADDVRGRLCHRVMGDDYAFGSPSNRPDSDLAPGDRPSTAFEVDVLTRGGAIQRLGVTTLRIPSFRPDLSMLVHLLQPVDEAARMARLLGQLARLLGPLTALGQGGSTNAATGEEGNGPGNGHGNGNGKGHGKGNGRATGHGNGHRPPPPGAVAVGAPQALTTRQREILHWMAAGLRNKAIAQKIDVSACTVRNHIHNMLGTLGVHSKLEAVSLAFRRQWITATPPTHADDVR
jgi:PAS domain S-box-containing protein